MTSPISSPQNIFAIQEIGRGGNSVSWLSWFAVALPIAFIGNLICWGALLAVYRPNKTLKEVRRLPDTTVGPTHSKLSYLDPGRPGPVTWGWSGAAENSPARLTSIEHVYALHAASLDFVT
jgi:hypothetical protein